MLPNAPKYDITFCCELSIFFGQIIFLFKKLFSRLSKNISVRKVLLSQKAAGTEVFVRLPAHCGHYSGRYPSLRETVLLNTDGFFESLRNIRIDKLKTLFAFFEDSFFCLSARMHFEAFRDLYNPYMFCPRGYRPGFFTVNSLS